MDPAKVKAIADWPQPKSVSDVRSFLGISGYYRRFIEGYLRIALPLTELLKADKKSFAWSEVASGAFVELKRRLTSALIIKQFDSKLLTHIETEASGMAVGGVLHQLHTDHHWYPVVFYSMKLNQAQRKYAVHEQELLAVVHALEVWRHYLYGIEFEVLTDHKSIEFIQTRKQLSN